MKTISQIIDDAPVTPEIDATFDKIKTALNAPFTPHFFRVWAASPESLKGIWPVMNHILTRGRVGRRLKEMIFVAISSLKSCHYCEAAHHAFCLNIGVSPSQIKNLIDNHTIDEQMAQKTRPQSILPSSWRRIHMLPVNRTSGH